MNGVVHDPVVVRDYLEGRLSGVELEAFEEQLVSDASLVREVEEWVRLREGLEVLRDGAVLDELMRPRQPRLSRRSVLGFAAAALIILAAGLYYAGLYSVTRADPIVAGAVAALRAHSNSALVVTRTHVFAALRHEAGSAPTLDLPASGALEIRALTPVTDGSQRFRVGLLVIGDGTEARIGLVEHVIPDGDGFVVIYADASRLETGEYSLSVEAEAGNTVPVERFEFALHR